MSELVAGWVRRSGSKTLFREWAARRRARKTYDELMALSDQTLYDIGLSRADIWAVSQDPAGQIQRRKEPMPEARSDQLAPCGDSMGQLQRPTIGQTRRHLADACARMTNAGARASSIVAGTD